MTDRPTVGAAIPRLLEAYGVRTIFGIPGVHTLELYRGLASSDLRHVTPRHEQGAGFMADGVGRVTGRPGVAFVITGPGVTNIATPMAQAMSDSSPMLVISSVAARRDLGADRLRLHEITAQRASVAPLVAHSHSLLDPDELPRVMARIFAGFAARRPGPVHLELPLDVIEAPCAAPLAAFALPNRPGPNPAAIDRAAAILSDAKRPLILLGGGAVDAHATSLAERLDAPVIMTTAGAGIVAADHDLAIGMGLSAAAGLRVVAEADVVLVIGSDMSETSHWTDRLPISGHLIRVDLDAASMPGDEPNGLFVHADATLAVAALLAALGPQPRAGGASRAAAARAGILAELIGQKPAHARLLAAIRAGLPREAHLLTDMTQIAYTANSIFPVHVPRGLVHPSGYGTLGFALPAATGAKIALGETPVACLIGDGGLQFTLPELATAAELGLPLPIILYDNGGYGQIRDDMRARGFQEIGVTFRNPDFSAVAQAWRCAYRRPDDAAALADAIRVALRADRPTLIHVSDATA